MTKPGRSVPLSEARIEAIFEKSGSLMSFPRGAAMLQFESAEPAVFLLLTGTAALHVSDQIQSHELNVIHLIPGEVFGSICPEVKNQIQMYILAKTECVAYVLTAKKLLAVCAADPRGMFAICSALSTTSMRALLKVGQYAFYDARGRVSSALVELCGLPQAKPHPEGFMLNATRVEIASMAGCTREMVGKIMRELSIEGLIENHGRQTLVRASPSIPL